MGLESRDLKMLAAIVEEGGVTRAANRLHVTQPALSHQLRNLEEAIGTAVFDRVNKKMILTPAGERLLVSSRIVLDELQRAEAEIRGATRESRGVLRISTECYTCYHWLPSRIQIFAQKFPAVEIKIVVEATRHPFAPLLDGELDLAIASTNVRNRKLIYTPLFQDELVVVMPPDHPLACRPSIGARDFADQHLIIYGMPLQESTVFQKILIPAGVTPRKLSQVQLTEGILELVRAGLGISVLARWAVAPQLARGELKAVPLERGGIKRQWSAVRRRNPSAPPYLIAFVDLLADHPIAVNLKKQNESKREAVVVARS
ncbi:MAG: LysR family transcriptional regulator [Candidatus Acidiferrales bacterium]